MVPPRDQNLLWPLQIVSGFNSGISHLRLHNAQMHATREQGQPQYIAGIGSEVDAQAQAWYVGAWSPHILCG